MKQLIVFTSLGEDSIVVDSIVVGNLYLVYEGIVMLRHMYGMHVFINVYDLHQEMKK
jgi:hypothetical protein